MGARPFLLAGVFATLVAACGSSPSSPSSGNAAQATVCPLTNGKVQVVIGYARDRTKVPPAGLLSFAPSLVLVDFGDHTLSRSANPQLTRIDDYTWSTTVFVIPDADAMSHGASVIDLAVLDASSGSPTATAVTGVTANGVQVRKVTSQDRI